MKLAESRVTGAGLRIAFAAALKVSGHRSLRMKIDGRPLFVRRDVLSFFIPPLFYRYRACSRPFASRFSVAFCPTNFCIPRDHANCIAMHIRNFLPARHLRFILSLIKNGPFGTSIRSEKLPTNFSRIDVSKSTIACLCPSKKETRFVRKITFYLADNTRVYRYNNQFSAKTDICCKSANV